MWQRRLKNAEKSKKNDKMQNLFHIFIEKYSISISVARAFLEATFIFVIESECNSSFSEYVLKQIVDTKSRTGIFTAQIGLYR